MEVVGMAVIINKKRVAIGVKQLPGGMTYDADKNVIIKDTTKVNEYVFNDTKYATYIRIKPNTPDTFIVFENYDDSKSFEVNFSDGDFINGVFVFDTHKNTDENILYINYPNFNEYVFSSGDVGGKSFNITLHYDTDTARIRLMHDVDTYTDIDFEYGQIINGTFIEGSAIIVDSSDIYLNNSDKYDTVIIDDSSEDNSFNVRLKGGEPYIEISVPEGEEVAIDYYSGNVIADGLEPKNIKEGVTILGRTGTCVEMPKNALTINVGNTERLLKPIDGTSTYNMFYSNGHNEEIQKVVAVLDTSEVTSMNHMFYFCTKLKTIPWMDTSNVTNMVYMFSGDESFDEFPLLDTSKVTNMNGMFHKCAIETIPLIDTSACTEMAKMFQQCTKLKTLPAIDTSNVTDMSYMFYGCTSLETMLILNTNNVSNMGFMFQNCTALNTVNFTSIDNLTGTIAIGATFKNCYSLTKLIIRNMTRIPALNTTTFNGCYHFTGTVHETYNPEGLKDGRIYVPDEYVASLKVSTNWSTYADCIVPLSTLKE